jgi:glucose/arabinose dehydrogenase
MMRFTPAGDLILTRSRAGEVVLLERDRDGDGRPDARRVLFAGLSRPHGLALHDGWLYIAEDTAIGRVRFDDRSGRTVGPYERIVTGLTANGNHFSKTIGFGPDGFLYLSQGSTCNVCVEADERRATMMRFDAEGRGGVIYARGLRNSVGFDWAPWDGALYATENGRDMLGDDVPPEELNRIVEGGDYGWPYVHGSGILDPDLGKGHEALLRSSLAPAHEFRAHNAPLGIRFLRSERRPPGYEHAALVALHGSWNRRLADGYAVVSLHWDERGRIVEKPFLTGFHGEGGTIGRPVDVAEGPDGAFYVSDDYAGVIYRVAWRGGAE